MSSPSLIKKAQAFAAEKQTKANYPGEAGSACVLDAIELAHILEDGGETDAILLAAAVLHARPSWSSLPRLLRRCERSARPADTSSGLRPTRSNILIGLNESSGPSAMSIRR